ncbi:MAG: Anthranilate synthase component 2 [Methanosaeta sp. PtaB.Bin039]|nr:MAG: Anthranilate synthase component 2 [Methanosaeta sp. PtaB.Bin039]OPY45157.1 MAG: Anthranilate synthase component 2 [Methanosaeta sp. PtaU1.Bin028]HOT07007.1 aminodeoxychorismate/anthranilate synthase component II [Methanotrichaceae archaeon]HQF16066.1 aminodeoxychorismate/anthranilate synthase component II [Methanotrichaceae archaeon]HQI90818.1 aminodeoxychorismate/anthranilate synthase component II [Methanotrichaceae archaeon]
MRPILFVDNQDSFVWNLVDYVSQFYPETVVVDNQIPLRQALDLQPAGVVISPGPGHPAHPRDIGSCLQIIREAAVPVLGVCLGHQAINLAFGGSIGRTIPRHGKVSSIYHDGRGLFAGLQSPLVGGRYHSLAVDRLSPELVVSARSGDGVVMGIRHRTRPVEGLQFHPESVLTPCGKKLISNWVQGVMACTR